MPGEIVLKCAECSSTTRCQDVKYVNGKMTYSHKLDCSQNGEMFPRMYSHQAQNPSPEVL